MAHPYFDVKSPITNTVKGRAYKQAHSPTGIQLSTNVLRARWNPLTISYHGISTVSYGILVPEQLISETHQMLS